MNRDTQFDPINRDPIDHILADEDKLVPSSGFLAGVMERVRDEAIAPKPIPFPWKRAVPGMVLAAGNMGWLIYEFIGYAMSGSNAGGAAVQWRELLTVIQAHVVETHSGTQQTLSPVFWIGAALALSLASWMFAWKLARRSSLL